MRLSTFIATFIPLLAASAYAATSCNGYASLCDKLYSNVTFIGAHDSYAVGSSIADNQDKSVTDQLNDGVRTLQIQTHNTSSGIHVCHTSCSLVDGGSLESYLATVTSWVTANPSQVITIIMVNIDDLAPTAFTSDFTTSGLSKYVYSPQSATTSLYAWPTLGTLIDAGTTVVVFMDEEADFSSVPYLIDEFSNMWEDAYDVTASTWDCAVNRSTGNSGSTMMLVNHFLDSTYTLGGTPFFVPNKDSLSTTNAAASISQHAGNCASIWGRAPNHILLDFYDSNGNAPFDFVATLNGVASPTNSVTTGNSGGTSGASASGSSASSGQTAVVSQKQLNGAGEMRGGGAGLWLGLGLSVMGVVVGAVGVF